MGCYPIDGISSFEGDIKPNEGKNSFPVGANSDSHLRKKIDISKYHKQFINKYGECQTEFPPFKWQKSFYDHYIRNEFDFQKHLHYTAYNHLKHHLPENWKFNNFGYPKLIND